MTLASRLSDLATAVANKIKTIRASDGSLFLGDFTVATLPVRAPSERATAFASNAVWSGGTGCQVVWNGSTWRDPDGNLATTTLKGKDFGGAALLNGIAPPAFAAFGVYQGHESNFLLFANLYDTVVATGIGNVNNLFDFSSSSGGGVAANATAVIEVTLTTPRTNIKALALGFVNNFPVRILLEADQGAGYFTVFDDTNPVIVGSPTMGVSGMYTKDAAGLILIDVTTPITKLKLTLVNSSGPTCNVRFFAMYDQALNPFSRSHLLLDGSNTMRGDLGLSKGAAARVQTSDAFDLELGANSSPVLTLKANGDAEYKGLELDARYALASSFTENVQDVVGALVANSASVDATYDDAGNVLSLEVVPGSASGAAGATSEIQFNNAGALSSSGDFTFDNATKTLALLGENTEIVLKGVTAEPPAPPPDTLAIYSKNVGGRMMAKIKGPSGLDTPLQAFLGGSNVRIVRPSSGTGLTLFGLPNTTVGTISHPALTATSLKTSTQRALVTSAATANAAAHLRVELLPTRACS